MMEENEAMIEEKKWEEVGPTAEPIFCSLFYVGSTNINSYFNS